MTNANKLLMMKMLMMMTVQLHIVTSHCPFRPWTCAICPWTNVIGRLLFQPCSFVELTSRVRFFPLFRTILVDESTCRVTFKLSTIHRLHPPTRSRLTNVQLFAHLPSLTLSFAVHCSRLSSSSPSNSLQLTSLLRLFTPAQLHAHTFPIHLPQSRTITLRTPSTNLNCGFLVFFFFAFFRDFSAEASRMWSIISVRGKRIAWWIE